MFKKHYARMVNFINEIL